MSFFTSITKPFKKAFSGVVNFVTGVVGEVVSWLIDIPEAPDFNSQQNGFLINKQSNDAAIPIVYGERKIGGTRVFVATSGADNEFLYLVIVLCEGEVNAIGDVFIDDTISTDSKFSGLVTINKYVGTDDQTADSTLVNAGIGWTSNHRLRGLAYLAVRIKFDQDVFSSLPTINAIVQGRKVYDPRSATTVYSSNPAICLRDYLTNSRYGKSLPTSVIDDTSFNATANKCDALIAEYSGQSEDTKIFECNAVIDTSQKLFDNVNLFLRGMRGIMPYQNGLYKLVFEDDEDPAFTINEDQIIGGLSVSSTPKNSRYNKVSVKFPNPDANWQVDTVIWPPAGSSEESTFLTEDNNIEMSREVTLPTITNQYSARDLARVICLASRKSTLSLSLEVTADGLQAEVGDIVAVTHPTPAWVGKEFRIASIQILAQGTVRLALQEHTASIYPWNEGSVIEPQNESTLPNPFTVSDIENLTLTATAVINDDGNTVPAIKIDWDISSDNFVQYYEIQFKRLGNEEDYGSITVSHTDSENWGSIATLFDEEENYGLTNEDIVTPDSQYTSIFGSTNSFTIIPVLNGYDYNVRVRAVNTFGVRSAFASATLASEGDTTPPTTPSGLSVNGLYKAVDLSWTNPDDQDLDYIEVWENTVNNLNTSTLIGTVSGTRFLRGGLPNNATRYYWVRAVDLSLNRSNFSTGAEGTTLLIEPNDFNDAVNDLFQEAGAFGIEPVDNLPVSGAFDGQIVLLKSDLTLYRWDATDTEWSTELFTASNVDPGTITAASFASGIEPVSVVTGLPSPTGYTGPTVVFNTTDNKLYRYNGTAFTAAISTQDLSGELGEGLFSDTLRPIERVASLPTTGLTQGRVVLLTTDNKLYRYTGNEWTKDIAATDVTGQLTGNQIADDAITTTKITDDAITSPLIAANAVAADNIQSNAVTAGKIAAGSISADKIASNAVTAGKVAADAITAGTIAAGAINASDLFVSGVIQSGAIGTGQIVTNNLAASSVISSKIGAGAVTADKISVSELSAISADLGTIQVDTANIADAAITNAKIGDTIQSSNYSSGSAGWQINKDGSAEFNGVVISRQLQVASGSHSIGSFSFSNPTSNRVVDAGYRNNNFDIYNTGISISAWSGTNKTYIAAIGISSATVNVLSSQTANSYWGFEAKVLPYTRFSGTQQLGLHLLFFHRNVTSVSNCTISWKIYEVS